MAQSRKTFKNPPGVADNRRMKESSPETFGGASISAPKYGTIVPARVFVGGITQNTTTSELTDFFSKYGEVKEAKIITDRAAVSKGYGFVTFLSDEDAKKVLSESDNIMLRERKLNVGPAIKKQAALGSRLDGASPGMLTGMNCTYHNGMAYFNQPQTSLVPSPTTPPAVHPPHMDPNIYTGYTQVQPPTPQYHPMYNAPFFYPPPQFTYPVNGCSETTTCEGTPDSTSNGLVMNGPTYFMTEMVAQTPVFDYSQSMSFPPPAYLSPYQPPLHDPNMINFSPRYYDQVIIPEQLTGAALVMAQRDFKDADKEENFRRKDMAGLSHLAMKAVNNNNTELANRNLTPSTNPSLSPQVPSFTYFAPRPLLSNTPTLPQPAQPVQPYRPTSYYRRGRGSHRGRRQLGGGRGGYTGPRESSHAHLPDSSGQVTPPGTPRSTDQPSPSRQDPIVHQMDVLKLKA